MSNNSLFSNALNSFITSFGLTILENELDKSYQQKMDAAARQHEEYMRRARSWPTTFKHPYRDYKNLGRGLSPVQIRYIDDIDSDERAYFLLRTATRHQH